jgi:MinD superfamily P-loop ATPase
VTERGSKVAPRELVVLSGKGGTGMVSETRCGPLVHARLGIGSGRSGKLVSTVRQAARALAEARGDPLVIVDGPPGIACPAIAALTGAWRLLSLARHFDVPVSV